MITLFAVIEKAGWMVMGALVVAYYDIDVVSLLKVLA